jgi:hypothetical protein
MRSAAVWIPTGFARCPACAEPSSECSNTRIWSRSSARSISTSSAKQACEVVRRVAAATSALAPFRLATIYRSDPRVRDRIDELHHDLVLALDRIEGCSEWSVKALIKSEAPSVQPDGGGRLADAGSGTAYLMRRRAQLDENRRAAENAAALADRLFRELAAGAEAGRRLPPQDPRLTGRSEPMALNSAFLVDDERVLAFQRQVEDLGNQYDEFHLEVDGPWPPYSFATLERV